MIIDAVCVNHMGRIRCNNEDNFFFDGKVLLPDNQGLGQTLVMRKEASEPVCVAVFDGMGGEQYGEEASFIAGNTLRKKLVFEDGCAPERFLAELCTEANQEICNFAKNKHVRCTGSTAAVLYAFEDRLWVCNLGDSRVYAMSEGNLVQWSVDHTDGAYLQKNGIKKKPSLTQHLGILPEEMMIEPFVDSRFPLPDEKYLLCSDGLTDMVDSFAIEAVLQEKTELKVIAEKLLKMALDNGGRDNITIILCQIKDV